MTDVSTLLAYPAGPNEWVHRRGLMHTLMGWPFPDDDDHAPIPAKVWDHVVTLLDRMPGNSLPPVLCVAHERDERLVNADVATADDMAGALLTSLVTAARLYEQLHHELDVAAGLRRRLDGGGAV